MAFAQDEEQDQDQDQDAQLRQAARDQRADEEEQLRQNVAPAGVSPDSRAEAIRLSDKLGVDVETVQRLLPEVKERQRREAPIEQRILRYNPKLAEWLRTSPAAAAAADDIPQLQELDNRLTFGATLLRGWDNAEAMLGRFTQFAGEVMPKGLGGVTDPTALSKYGRRVAEHNERQARDLGYKSTLDDAFDSPAAFGQYVKEQVGENIPTMAPSLIGGVVGGLIGGPVGAAIGAGIPAAVMGIGETEGQVKAIDPEAQAPVLVFIGGSAIGALDAVVPGEIGGRLAKTFGRETAEAIVKRALEQPLKPKFLRSVVGHGIKEMASEGITEAIQEAIGDLTANTATGRSNDWRQIGRDMLEAGAAGAIVGGTFSASASAATHHRERAQFESAQQQKAFFTALGTSMTDSKLAQRLPAGSREFIAKWTKDGPLEHVYQPIDSWNEYWQSKDISPAAMAAELTGRADALEHATKTGSDLVIPLAAYAEKLAATEHNAFFAQELKLDPKLLNLRQTKELAQTFRDVQQGNVGTPAVMDEKVAAGAAEVGKRIYDQAIASGELPAIAEKWQELYSTAYGNIAQRYKRDPVQLFEQRPLSIMRDDGAVFTPAAKGERIGVDIPASEATPGENQQQRRTRRTAHFDALVSSYVRDARAQDPNVDPAMIRAEVEQRVEMADEATRATRESGIGVDLLKAIAGYGGIRDTGSHPGEFKHYAVEGQDKRRRGARDRRTWNGVEGVFDLEGKNPRSLGFDDMVRSLMQDQRFAHLGDDLNVLIDAIDSAMRAKDEADVFPGTEELQDLGIVPGTKWWENSWLTGPAKSEGKIAESEGNISEDAIEPSADESVDDTFNPDEFMQRKLPDDVKAQAFVLYRDRGAGQSVVRMAQALRELGVTFPSRTKAERLASNAIVAGLVREAEEGGELYQRRREGITPEELLEDLPKQESAIEYPGNPDSRRVPFPVIDNVNAERIWRASIGLATAQYRLQPVALKDIVATQPTFALPTVLGYLRGEGRMVDAPPILMFLEGRYYIADGTHRSVADWAKGAVTIDARVFDVDVEQLRALEAAEAPPPSGTPGPPVIAQQPPPKAGVYGVGGIPSGVPTADATETLEARGRIEDARAAAKAQVDQELGITPQVGRQKELYQLDPDDEPAGFEAVKAGLSEDEAQRLRDDTAETLISVFETLPQDVDWRDVAIAGGTKKGWYATGTKAIQAVFGPVDAPRFTALLAAMSPRVQVQENLTNALRMWIMWDEAGRPTAPAKIKDMLARSRGKSAITGEKRKLLNSWTNNVVRVLRTPDGGRFKLSGSKVESFMQNLLGNMEEVTNDAWMAGWALLDQKVLAGNELRDELTGELLEGKSPSYVAFNAKTRIVAQQLTRQTGELWTPANVQETVWSWQKTLYELAKEHDESAVRLVRQGVLTDAAIAQTPDFARLMARDATIREILEAAGYGKVLRAVETIVAADARRRDAASKRAGAGPGEASQRVTPGILRSARRIDELRRRRQAASDAERAQKLRDTKRRMRKAGAAARARRAQRELTQPGRRTSNPRAVPSGVEREALNAQLDTHLQGILEELSTEVAGADVGAFIAAGGDIYVETLEIPPTARGEGYGTRVMRKLFAFADKHNLAISLYQAADPGKKEALRRFYRKLGFIRNGTGRYYDPRLAGPWVRPSKSERGDAGELHQETWAPLAEDFYSRIFRTVEGSTQKQATGKQWKGTIRNSKLGINLDEYAALGVDALEDDKSYTREQVLEHIAKHEIAIEVRTRDDGPEDVDPYDLERRTDRVYDGMIDEQIGQLEDDGEDRPSVVTIGDVAFGQEEDDGDWIAMFDEEEIGRGDTEDDAQREANAWIEDENEKRDKWYAEHLREQASHEVSWSEAEDVARQQLISEQAGTTTVSYGEYVEPGADDDTYREVHLTAPNAKADVTGMQRQLVDEAIQMAEREADAQAHNAHERRVQIDLVAIWTKLKVADSFRTYRNPDAPGFTPFFTALTYEENQELIREDGFRVERVARAKTTTWEDGHDDYSNIKNPIVRVRYNIRTSADGTKTMFLEEVQPPGPENQKLMPKLFVKHWRELAMKWALRQAVISKVDKLAWTSGAMQVQRYNLAKHVSSIAYFPESQLLAAYDQEGGNAIREQGVTPEDLPRYIGEAMTARLLGSTAQANHRYRLVEPPEGSRAWAIVDDSAPDRGELYTNIYEDRTRAEFAKLQAGTLTRHSIDLDPNEMPIGGEGLTKLYDKDLPAIVSKIVKSAGAKVVYGAGAVSFGKVEQPLPAHMVVRAADITNENIGALRQREADWRKAHPPMDLWKPTPVLEITSAVRDQVMKGLALYQPDKSGRDIQAAFNPDNNVVRLISGKADLSSFLHESGHFFLELLGDIATTIDPNTQDPNEQQLLADMATVLKYGNYQGTLAEWRALPLAARADVHEAFARGFEQYLSDGRAPSPQLRQLFMRFRDWIVAAYRSAKGLGIEVPDDVRGVFDRLLASDEAIADAQEQGNVQPLFTDPATAGVDPLTFEAYRQKMADANVAMREDLDRRLMKDWKRERQAWWKAEREGVEHQVRDEVHADPLYIALAVMRTGKLPDGSMPTMGDGRPLKLSKTIIKREFPRALYEQLARQRPVVYSVEGGLHPDAAAELFGFASGEALLEAAASAAPMARVIEDETNRRMRQAHGDLMLDGMQLREVAEGVVQDRRGEIISEELRVLTQGMAGAAIPPAHIVKEEAEAFIRRQPFRELRPGRYLQAARTASRKAFEAFAKNDRRGAVEAKKTELVALAHWRAARDAKERGDQIRDRLMEYSSKNSIRAKLAKAGGGFLEQIDGFLSRYEFQRVTQKAIDRRANLRDFLEQLQADGLPIEGIPKDVIDDSRQVNWQELPLEELEGVYQAVRQIHHLATLKNKLLLAKDAREIAAVRAEIAASIREHVKERAKTHEPRSAPERRRAFFEGMFASHRKIAHLARELDGFQDGGSMWQYVIRPLNEAANKEATMNADATARLGALFKQHYTAKERGDFGKPQWIPALGDRTNRLAALTREARIMVALNWGNETNRKRVMAGKGWSEQQVNEVLDTLDKRDWQFVQGVWDFIDGYWPDIAAKQQRVRGFAPKKEEATPVFTRFGEFKGGYFPLVAENELSGKFDKLKNAGAAAQQQAAAYSRAVPAHGYVEERAEGNVVYPVRLDFGVIFQHTTQVIHDLTHHEALIDIGRVIGSDEVDQAIRETLGPRAVDQFTRALHDIAVGDTPAQHEMESAIGYLRTGATVAGLAWSVSTMMLQPFGLTQSVSRIGAKWVFRGTAKWVRGAAHMEGVVAGIHEKSEFMRNRARTVMREINELRNQVVVGHGGRVRQAMEDSFFTGIGKFQMVADVPTWLGAYERALSENHPEDTAIALADQAVLDSQGGGQIKDLAAVQRGGPAWKLWTNFYSFFSTTYNLWTDSYRRAKQTKDPIEIGRLAVDYMLLFAVPALLGHVMRSAITGSLGDELDDPEEFAITLAGELGAYMFGTMIGLRELGGFLQGYNNYSGPAGARGFSTAGNLLVQARQMKADEAFFRALNAAAGVYFHYPAAQVDRTVRGIIALANGETQNPLAPLVGPPPKRRR